MRGRPVRLRRVGRDPARQQRRRRLGLGRRSCSTSAASRATTGCATSCTAPTARCWSPIPATSTTCRAGSCRRVQAMGEPFTHDFNGPTQRGVGFYQFMNRRGKRSSAAYAFIEPLQDDPRLTVRLQRRGRAASRSRTAAPSASPSATPTGASRRRARQRRHRPVGRRAGDPEAADAVGHRSGRRICASTASTCLVDLPGVGQNLIDHPEVPVISDRQRPLRLLPAGRRLADAEERAALQAVRHRPDPLRRRRGRRLRQSDRSRRRRRRSRPSACRSSISTATC